MLDIAPDEIVLAHPVRAIERKDVPRNIAIAEDLDATYWLWGPAEDGYGDELAGYSTGPVARAVHRAPDIDPIDLYRAANAVLFLDLGGLRQPTWSRRPCTTFPPQSARTLVAEELRRLGFRWFPTDDAGPLGRFLADPDPALLAHNRDVARTYLSLESMTEALRALFDEAGWIP